MCIDCGHEFSMKFELNPNKTEYWEIQKLFKFLICSKCDKKGTCILLH